ncbi:Hypothetical protein PHPALM_2263 [Phytophthora palmivora]|uniref:Uncharacterized protein n=1 Tax=Phytophthora palmivora TaxID=4796 RepID=A0A2P4YQ83_9STRA|nr:Hypothetical protein PHPALM_2263 [Phytophthora palmivora]
MGADDHHSTTVSAGDFLDEKFLVLTASVDAIVKVWDQQRVLLRQVTLATAVTSLCFLNADGDLLAGLSKGTFLISQRDVLPDKIPKPVPRRRIRDDFRDTTNKLVQKAANTLMAHKTASPQHQLPAIGNSMSASAALPPPQKISLPSRPPDPETSAKQLLAHVIQRPVEAAKLCPPVLRNLNSPRRIVSNCHSNFGNNNSSERQTTSRVPALTDQKSMDDSTTEQQEEDWRDKILPLSAYQKLMRAPQRGLSYRRKRCQTPSSPLVLQRLGSSPRTSFTKRQPFLEKNVECQNSTEVGLGVGAADAPLLYCKHQAPVPPKDKTPRKLWNAIGGEDRRLIVLQRNHLPPC